MERATRRPDDVLDEACARRDDAAATLAGLSHPLAVACAAMADGFTAGGQLRPVGQGVSAIDAAHIGVEFVHPVITGKRALPALALAPGDVRLVRPGSTVLGLRLDHDPDVAAALRGAQRLGCSTIELGRTGLDAVHADHRLLAETDDRLVARESHVTLYHLLWELVHEHLDAATATDEEAPDDLGSLYPFLYARDPTDDGFVDALVEATEPKLVDIHALRLQAIERHRSHLVQAAETIRRARAAGGTVWTFGNGGSSTDAQALALLLSEGGPGASVDARALTDDVATITALSNDVGFDIVFARMLRSLAGPDDVAVGLSTSGGSANVLAGLDAAHDLGLATIGLAGYDGGAMADLDSLDTLLVVPSSSVHRIQEAQTTLLHVLVELSRT